MFNIFPKIAVSGICKITGNQIKTFDGVQYPFLKPKCEYIVAQDTSPSQQFLVVVSKRSQNQDAKVSKS